MNKYTDIHTGLSSAEVTASREKYGSNQLTPPSRDPWWVQLLEKFTDPLIVILMVAAVISFIPVIIADHSPIESIGIITAVLLATLVGFINEQYVLGKAMCRLISGETGFDTDKIKIYE